jgi:hypothetical protein
MKTVALGYMFADETHFLFTPNLLLDEYENGHVDKNGHELGALAFSKNWDECMGQMKNQLTHYLGGKWGPIDDIDNGMNSLDSMPVSSSKMQLAQLSQ